MELWLFLFYGGCWDLLGTKDVSTDGDPGQRQEVAINIENIMYVMKHILYILEYIWKI